MNAEHKNHEFNKQTFLHYSQNLRLTAEEEAEAASMIEVGGVKQKIKCKLMSKREAPVSLKTLHNLKTKMNKNVRNDPDEFSSLLTAMRQVPGAKIDVAYDEDNELIGVYYQDARMAALFESYPEIVVFDATYKLNDRRMPLFLMMIIDGAGETEVACVWIIRS